MTLLVNVQNGMTEGRDRLGRSRQSSAIQYHTGLIYSQVGKVLVQSFLPFLDVYEYFRTLRTKGVSFTVAGKVTIMGPQSFELRESAARWGTDNQRRVSLSQSSTV